MPVNNKNTWIMVANGSMGRVFCFNDKKSHIELIKEVVSETAHSRSAELGNDRPGRVYESANSARHAVEPKTDLHRKEKARFAHLMASLLDEGANSQKFSDLILISSPEFLGDIRAELSKYTYSMVKKEINKDLTHINKKEILNYIN